MTKYWPECGRSFDHDPKECWDCGVNTVHDDQGALGEWSG